MIRSFISSTVGRSVYNRIKYIQGEWIQGYKKQNMLDVFWLKKQKHIMPSPNHPNSQHNCGRAVPEEGHRTGDQKDRGSSYGFDQIIDLVNSWTPIKSR